MITVELSRASQGLRQALWQLDAAAERAALAPPALLLAPAPVHTRKPPTRPGGTKGKPGGRPSLGKTQAACPQAVRRERLFIRWPPLSW